MCSVLIERYKMENQFLHNIVKHSSFTENGAIAHSSIGSTLADQFSQAGSQRNRSIDVVFAEQSQLEGEYPESALIFPFYLRLITRKIKGVLSTEKVQRGQGNRDESFKRLLWYAVNKPELFYNNLVVLISVGSIKDIWDLLVLAKSNSIELDEYKLFSFYANLLRSENTVDLAKKYLPTIHSNRSSERSKVRTKLARDFAKFLNCSEKEYRKLKVSGKAHTFQQKISNKKFKDIRFNRIPGRALLKLGTSKFISNQNLEKEFLKFLNSQPTAKFTGYVYELGNKVTRSNLISNTLINKQFDGLIELAKEDTGGISGNVWCAIDTSASMQSTVANTTAFNICISLGIYFSTLNTGEFNKHIVMFDNNSTLKKLSGNFSDMWNQITSSTTARGSTNFQSVIDLLVETRERNPQIPLEDYPETLLVISDMQFNPVKNDCWYSSPVRKPSSQKVQTNHEAAKEKLSAVFPKEYVDNFKVVWWDCTGRRPDNKPTHMDEGGTYVFSGFDGAILSLLLGENTQHNDDSKEKPSLEEMIVEALSQEIFEYLQIS